jgi:hypothetical protein
MDGSFLKKVFSILKVLRPIWLCEDIHLAGRASYRLMHRIEVKYHVHQEAARTVRATSK